MDGRAWVWFGPVLLALAWPVVHAAIFLVRFGHWPDGGPGASLIFLPMGVVASLVLALLLQVARQPRQRARILLGYALAAPFAFVGSLLGGLVLPPLLGTILLGAGPLVLGMLIAYYGASALR